RHLVRSTHRSPLLVLGTYRPEAVGPGHPLQDLLADGHGDAAVTRIELQALTAVDVAELVAVRVPDVRSQSTEDIVDLFARRVFSESGGSPFFVCELLDHLAATGQLERLVGRDGDAGLPIPDSVRDVVGQRLARLPDGAGRVLSSAAVIGLSFDLELLAHLDGGDEEQVLEVLEEVARVALVREVEAGRFTFDHAIVRSTILDGMSASRRALSHRRIAEAIESLRRPDPDELAHHWRLAGVEDKAIAALELAGRRDLEALAYESAADRYRVVLDFHLRDADADRHAVARARLGLGLSLRALGQVEYIDDVEEAGRLGRALHDGDVVAAAAIASIWPG
ncbi:hypothetical protein B7486_61615, partial [cyanobacterium TDX16]